MLMAGSAVMMLLPTDLLAPFRNMAQTVAAPPQMAALRAVQAVSGAVADITLFDPETEAQRTFTIGEAEVTLEAEDLGRRLPLAWLAEERRREFTEIALQRLIEEDALRPTKINGRLAFDKDESDRIVQKGDRFRRRGRPRKNSR